MSALCHKQTYAAQQKNAYSITPSVRPSSESGIVKKYGRRRVPRLGHDGPQWSIYYFNASRADRLISRAELRPSSTGRNVDSTRLQPDCKIGK
jgi:hypothetical protein